MGRAVRERGVDSGVGSEDQHRKVTPSVSKRRPLVDGGGRVSFTRASAGPGSSQPDNFRPAGEELAHTGVRSRERKAAAKSIPG
jgi:hypothetical protein